MDWGAYFKEIFRGAALWGILPAVGVTIWWVMTGKSLLWLPLALILGFVAGGANIAFFINVLRFREERERRKENHDS